MLVKIDKNMKNKQYHAPLVWVGRVFLSMHSISESSVVLFKSIMALIERKYILARRYYPHRCANHDLGCICAKILSSSLR